MAFSLLLFKTSLILEIYGRYLCNILYIYILYQYYK